jgi:hypothetical protein
MALDSLTATLTAQLGWTAQKNVVGSDYSANVNASTIKKSLAVGTSAANAAVGGADELYSAVTSLTASASASIDLTAIADILNQAGISLARVKGILIRVLSATDDNVIGTAAVGVVIDGTVTNALSSQSNSGWFSNAAEGAAGGSKLTVPNGGFVAFGTPSAGGVVVDATHKVIKITNLDGAVTAKCQISVMGGST